MKVRNVSLVRPDNETYREHQGKHAEASRSLRPSMGTSPIQKVSEPIERVLRELLSRNLVTSSRRILHYEKLQRTNAYRSYYKEIDAVEVKEADGEERPIRLFEIKTSSNASRRTKAGSQLRRAERVLQTRWSSVRLHALFVALVPRLMRLPSTPVDIDAFTTSLTSGPADESRLTTILSAEDVWKWGRDHDLLGGAESLLASAQKAARQTIKKRRWRSALKKQGVPKTEWPEDLRTDSGSDRPDPERASFGEGEEASALERALRGADLDT
jgi:hypothetical protein